jgi:hypothetical protein
MYMFVCCLFWWYWSLNQGLSLAGQVPYHSSHTSLPFLLFILQVVSCIFAWGWPQTMILLPTASCVAGITGAYYHTWLIDSDGISLTFWLGWPWMAILPNSTFWVARIIDMSCCVQLHSCLNPPFTSFLLHIFCVPFSLLSAILCIWSHFLLYQLLSYAVSYYSFHGNHIDYNI